MQPEDFDLRTISLGAGVQSTTLYRMAALGEIPGPRPSHAIFADTKCEPQWVYDTLNELERDHGDVIPILRVSAGDLGEDWFSGQQSSRRDEPVMGASIPVHLRMPDGSKGMGGRTCTHRYKVTPIIRAQRDLLGLKPGARAAGRYRVESWIGISLDEVQRVKDSPESWVENRYPLVFDVPMRRGDCLSWLEARGFPLPRRSACYFCPFRSNAEWRDLKSDPDAWSAAVAYDERLRREPRYISSQGSESSQYRGIPFLHASRVPLAEANLYNHDERQIDLFDNECEGMCGV